MSDHKQRRRFGNPGPRTGNSRASIEKQEFRPRILIVCEGAKTEPNYFHSFRVTNDIYGKGLETIRVVESAIKINKGEGPFDQIWCVFDRDSFPADDFDNAIHMVEIRAAQGFRVAYSNEAFELWYILHFEYLAAALPRDRYFEKIATHLGSKYIKGDPRNYILVHDKGSEDLAIQRAERLLAMHNEEIPISQRCPVTTVHELVKVLRQVQRQR